MMMETAFTLDEVAKFLKVSPRTVRRLATKGEIPGRKIGNHWRFSPVAVHRWLAGEGVPKPADEPSPGGVETLLIEISRLLSKMISEQPHDKPDESEKFYGTSGVERKTGNPHLDFFGVFASDPLAQEVEDFIQAEKECQRQMAQSEEI
ncbi:helix-turn-helix domain-containing protein [Candidatus Poribacteria bacterium]|nr:helix-turn-helix domain-containing protein [Candidatus Poribacteria bacterium]